MMDIKADTPQTLGSRAILALNALGQTVTASLKLEDVLRRALREVGALMNADATAIQLPERDKILVSLRQPTVGQVKSITMSRNTGVAGHVLRTGEVYWLCRGESSAPHVVISREVGSLTDFALGSMLAAPLMNSGNIVGVLEVAHRDEDGLTQDDLPLLMAAANWTAIAIANARLHEEAQRAREEQALLQERNRLARELHDAVTQSLYSISTLAGAWRRQIEAGTLQPSREQIAELGELASQALREVRLLVYELRPSELEEEGLLGAIYRRLEMVEKRTGMHTQLKVTDEAGKPVAAPHNDRAAAVEFYRLPRRVEHTLFRIVQEALNNALKHSGATSVQVQLCLGSETLWLEVRDDGNGLNKRAAVEAPGFGLASMRERAEQIGGRLTIRAVPGEGTTVRIEDVPYRLMAVEEMVE